MAGKRILCGIDFSNGSRAAFRVACELAQLLGALLLVHVDASPTSSSESRGEIDRADDLPEDA